MAIAPISYQPQQAFSAGADFSPLERIGQMLAEQRNVDEAARLIGQNFGGAAPPQQESFLMGLGRKLGLVPEAAPQVATPVVPAGLPSDQASYAPPPSSGAAPITFRPGITASAAPGDAMANYKQAASKIESGGRYDLLGPMTKTGDRAYGKYQVMGANVPSWTKAALGREMTPEEFRNNPEAQEAVFEHRFGGYVQKYGPENAAKAWFAGERGMKNPNARDQLGTTVSSYAEQFKRNLGAGPRAIDRAMERPQTEQDLNQPSPLDTAQWPHGPVGAPSTDVSAQSRAAPQAAASLPAAAAAIRTNLASGQPAQAVGLDRNQLAELYRNPITRPLATAFLQKQFDPGKYDFKEVGGKLYRINDRTGAATLIASDTKPVTLGVEQRLVDPETGREIAGAGPSKPVQVDTGTATEFRDPRTGQLVNRVPKDVAGAAEAKATGEATATAKTALPMVETNAKEILSNVDALVTHPGKSDALGVASYFPTVRGSPAHGFETRLEQVKGQAFLSAYDALRGAGQITEQEGKAATAAYNRMTAAQSEKEFNAAAKEFREHVITLRDNARQKAKGGGTALSDQTTPAGTPQVGATVNGYRYLGGNPKDPKSWAK
jgi:hypothetical protein